MISAVSLYAPFRKRGSSVVFLPFFDRCDFEGLSSKIATPEDGLATTGAVVVLFLGGKSSSFGFQNLLKMEKKM